LEAGKLSLILLVILPMLLGRPDTSRGLRIGVQVAAVVNAGVLVAGALGLGSFIDQRSVGRFDTVLNGAGSLWRVGILVLVWSALRLLVTKMSLWPVLVFVASIILIVFDGSRTGAICLVAAVGFVAWFVTREIINGKTQVSRRLLTGSVFLGTTISLAFIFAPGLASGIGTIGFLERGSGLYESIVGNRGGGIDEADGSRAEMLRDTLAGIIDHPVIGTGMGTTRTQTDVGPMVVHIAYLQVWADVGLMGFLAYGALTLGALAGPWSSMRRVSGASLEDRIDFFNGIFVLFCFAISGLLHPLSTELTEWVMFLTGLAGLRAGRWRRAAVDPQSHFTRIPPAAANVGGTRVGSVS
jgi:hypothetical protein